jgi:hypothetical protein
MSDLIEECGFRQPDSEDHLSLAICRLLMAYTNRGIRVL